MKNVAVVYLSKHGHTKRYAEWLKEDLGADTTDIIEVSRFNITQVLAYKLIIFACGVYGDKLAIMDFVKKNVSSIPAQKAMVMAVSWYTNDSEEATKKLIDENFPDTYKNAVPLYVINSGIDKKGISPMDNMKLLASQVMIEKKDGRSSDDINALAIIKGYSDQTSRDNLASVKKAVEEFFAPKKKEEPKPEVKKEAAAPRVVVPDYSVKTEEAPAEPKAASKPAEAPAARPVSSGFVDASGVNSDADALSSLENAFKNLRAPKAALKPAPAPAVEEIAVEEVSAPKVEEFTVEEVSSPKVEEIAVEEVPAPKVEEFTVEDVPAPKVEEFTVEDVPAPKVEEFTVEEVSTPKVEEFTVEEVSAPKVEEFTVEEVSAPKVEEFTVEEVSAPKVDNINDIVIEEVPSFSAEKKPSESGYTSGIGAISLEDFDEPTAEISAAPKSDGPVFANISLEEFAAPTAENTEPETAPEPPAPEPAAKPEMPRKNSYMELFARRRRAVEESAAEAAAPEVKPAPVAAVKPEPAPEPQVMFDPIIEPVHEVKPAPAPKAEIKPEPAPEPQIMFDPIMDPVHDIKPAPVPKAEVKSEPESSMDMDVYDFISEGAAPAVSSRALNAVQDLAKAKEKAAMEAAKKAAEAAAEAAEAAAAAEVAEKETEEVHRSEFSEQMRHDIEELAREAEAVELKAHHVEQYEPQEDAQDEVSAEDIHMDFGADDVLMPEPVKEVKEVKVEEPEKDDDPSSQMRKLAEEVNASIEKNKANKEKMMARYGKKEKAPVRNPFAVQFDDEEDDKKKKKKKQAAEPKRLADPIDPDIFFSRPGKDYEMQSDSMPEIKFNSRK